MNDQRQQLEHSCMIFAQLVVLLELGKLLGQLHHKEIIILVLDDAKILKLIQLGYMGASNDMEKKFWENFIGGTASPDGTSFYRGKTGQTTQASDGLKTVFTVAHGMPGVPVYASMIGRNTNSGGEKFVNWDATNISVTYLVAPPNGSVVFNWIALI